MAYEYFYPGTPYTLEPEYGDIFSGYRVSAGELGASTSIQTANQLKEVSNLLNQGMKVVEVSAISPEVFEMIPKQHLKEINRLSKLTGSETSLHAPIIDPSGFTQQGWDEANREVAERQFEEVVERAHELNPKGNIPVTIHASGVPGTEDIPIDAVKDLTPEEKEKYGKIGKIPRRMVAVNQETGEFIPLVREKRYYPGEEKIYSPEEELKIVNESYWDQRLSQLTFYKNRGDELLRDYYEPVKNVLEGLGTGKYKEKDLTPTQKAVLNQLRNVDIYLRNAHQSVNSLFNQAYKYSDEKTREELKKAAEEFKKKFQEARVGKVIDPAKYSEALQIMINKMQEVTDSRGGNKPIPELYKPVEEFTKEKAADTLSNVALHAYKKFEDKAPIISVENPPYGMAISTASDLKELIEKSRKKFAEKLVKERKMSMEQAKKTAEKLIGVTWDTSHISMMRKQGFKEEELVKEAKKIAPYVKHVHLNDNFGSTHTDLPPGMGNVPIKEILKEFEKAGVKGKKVFEGGNFFQHFQTSPHPYVLEALGSPLYGAMMQPYWNQITATYGNYFAFPSAYFPEQHFSLYGGGFSSLPQELGGQVPGKRDRVSGTPMA